MKTTITEQERLQLLGLLTLGIKHQRIVNQVDDAIAEIVQEETGNLLSDAVYDGNDDIDHVLKNMGITVETSDA
jgi:hypothetical protein